MDSADFPENPRESRGISPENSSSEEILPPDLASLDVLAQVAEQRLVELVFETGVGVGVYHDFFGRFTESNRGLRGDETATSASGERRGISGENDLRESERREALERKIRMDETRRLMYKTAKQFAQDLHSNMAENAEHQKDHKKQRIEEDELFNIDEFEGPFGDALGAIKKRSSLDPDAMRKMLCADEKEFNLRTRVAPSLLELSLRMLGKYADDLVSLQSIPDLLKSKIASVVSRLGGVNNRFMKLLVKDSPTMIRVKNCTNLEEKDLTGILCDCDPETLRVLKLDLCGRAMTERVIGDFLSRSPKGFPALTNVSLKGAFSLTDNGLALLSRCAPLLQRVNLSHCSLLTDHAIQILADNFGNTLESLNIEGCQGINPSHVLHNLRRLKRLSSVSVAGLESINDYFVIGLFQACGWNLTSLDLAGCMEVTDDTIMAMEEYCPELRVLDLSFLNKLTDRSLQSIANGCSCWSRLKFCRNGFSDDGIAALLEVSGGSLEVLSLNNIRSVGLNTVISLAKVSKKLHSLDLSWCRNVTDEDLRLILRSCQSLRRLKLFGFSQVTKEFLEEHSVSSVQIIGLRMAPLLEHLDDIEPVFDQPSDSE